MDMSIVNLSMAQSQSSVSQGVGISMLKKGMEQIEQTGAQMAEMISQTSVAHPGSSIDLKV